MGLMSRSKSTTALAGGGNLAPGISAARTGAQINRIKRDAGSVLNRYCLEGCIGGAASIPESRINVGAVNGCVTTGGPASSHFEQGCMQDIADVDLSWGRSGTLDLGVTAQTEVGIALRE